MAQNTKVRTANTTGKWTCYIQLNKRKQIYFKKKMEEKGEVKLKVSRNLKICEPGRRQNHSQDTK